MHENPENLTTEKRSLKKVRKPNLDRNNLPSEQETLANEQMDCLPVQNNVQVLNKCMGLVEINGKILISVQYLNPFLKISSPRIEDIFSFKAVTLNLNFKSECTTSWQTIVQKLESYGDAEHMNWAQRMRSYYERRPKLMEGYFKMVTSNNNKTLSNLRKAKARAVLACREIETKYSYRKLLTFCGKDQSNLLSISYSENFIKALGHDNPEEFIAWTKTSGLPGVFDEDCPQHIQLAQDFFDLNIMHDNQTINSRPEYTTYIHTKDGQRKQITAQYISIMDPTSDGFFMSGYFVIKSRPSKNPDPVEIKSTLNELELIREHSTSSRKNSFQKNEIPTELLGELNVLPMKAEGTI